VVLPLLCCFARSDLQRNAVVVALVQFRDLRSITLLVCKGSLSSHRHIFDELEKHGLILDMSSCLGY
jgi:hypothetical protein